MKTCIAFFITLLFSVFIRAEETNELYVTDSSLGVRLMVISNKIQQVDIAHDPMLVEAAKKTRESLPAKDFPEGNWGAPAFGLQVSLRLAKSVYTNGEPISAVVLVRNVTNSAVGYICISFGDGDDPISLVVTTETGQILERPKQTFVSSGAGEAMLAPITQHKYQEHVGGYHLTNGTYLVHASAKIALETQINGKHGFDRHEVNSAAVTIKVE